MNQIKLDCAKFANAVKCGVKEETFVTNKNYDISLVNDFRIKIVDQRTKRKTYTTVMNTIYWEETPEAAEVLPPAKPKAQKAQT